MGLLFDEMEINYSKLFGQFSSKVTKEDKKKIWMTIADSLNRDVEDVRRKFTALKSEKLRQYSIYRRKMNGTGGGPPPRDLSPLTQRLLDVIGENNPKVQGIGSQMDSSNLSTVEAVEEAIDSDDENRPPKAKRVKVNKESKLESLLIQQSEERHKKEMELLDLKIQNAKLKNQILRQRNENQEDIVVEGVSSYRCL